RAHRDVSPGRYKPSVGLGGRTRFGVRVSVHPQRQRGLTCRWSARRSAKSPLDVDQSAPADDGHQGLPTKASRGTFARAAATARAVAAVRAAAAARTAAAAARAAAFTAPGDAARAACAAAAAAFG